MARYFLLQNCSFENAMTAQVGTTVHCDGPPGAHMYPMNPAARAARAHVLARRTPEQRHRDEMLQQRWRRGIPKHVRKQLDQADAEAVHDGEIVAAPVVRKKSSNPGGVPQTYPGAWKTGVNRLRSAVINPR